MAATIHKQLYVTIQYRKDAGNDDGHLGFASPYTKDAAFQKRKATQDSWAYGSGTTIEIDEKDDITYTATERAKVDAASAFIGGWYPQIVNNEPVEGFEIAKSVRRYGWSGSGNVVWRITDPRGFDLEISSDNFASIIACVDMEKGAIKGKCVWGRDGAKNVLLPEASEPFQEAMARTKKVNQKVSLRDVNPGDTVDVITTKIAEDDAVAVYLGKMHVLTKNKPTEGVTEFANNQIQSYFFKSVKTGTFFAINSSPKISSIVTAGPANFDTKAAAAEINAFLNDKRYAFDNYNVLLVSDTKIEYDQVEVVKVPVSVNINDWPKVDSYYMKEYFAEFDGKSYVVSGSKYSRALELTLSEAVLDGTVLKYNVFSRSNNNYYGRSNIYTVYTTVKKVDTTGMEFFDLVVKFNGLERNVTYI